MGNKESAPIGRVSHAQTISNQKNIKIIKKKPEITPFREGLSGFTQSPLLKFINDPSGKKEFIDLENANFEAGLSNEEYELREMEKIQKRYFSDNIEEFNNLKKAFEENSKENKMSKRKLLDFFGLTNLDNTKFGNRFFNSIKGVNY